MIIGSISENKNLEKRISITPDIAKKYITNGFQILLENDYGSHLGISDDEFINKLLAQDIKIDSKGNHQFRMATHFGFINNDIEKVIKAVKFILNK